MSKNELVEIVAKEADLTKVAAEKAVSAVLEGITKALKKGEKVTFVGFGTFATSKRAARTGRNPQTGETVKIAARTAVSFKAGSKLKEAVN
jgi:DNA-binding protein HU-beta